MFHCSMSGFEVLCAISYNGIMVDARRTIISSLIMEEVNTRLGAIIVTGSEMTYDHLSITVEETWTEMDACFHLPLEEICPEDLYTDLSAVLVAQVTQQLGKCLFFAFLVPALFKVTGLQQRLQNATLVRRSHGKC